MHQCHRRGLVEPVGKVVNLLLELPDQFGGMTERASGQAPARFAEPVAQIFVEPLLELPEFGLEFGFRFHDQLGGGARCRRAQIGDEIGNGEINFVADGGDGRNPRPGDGAGDDFFVERPQIFE